MDRFESMSILVAVVEAGSLSGAGRRLRMSVPTISRRITELEGQLRAKLLARSTRKLALTEAGQAYLAACRRILEDVAEAERLASGEYSAPRGELVITAPIVFGRLHVLPVVAEFLKAYHDVNIRFVLTDSALDLLGEQVDLAVRIGELPDGRMVATRIGQVRLVACASPAYCAAHGVPETPEDLATHQCVTFVALSGPQGWTFRERHARRPVSIKSRLIVNTAEAAVDATIAGIGITRVVSYQVADRIKAGELKVVLQNFEPAPRPVNLVYTAKPPLPLKLRAFLDFATPRLKSRIAAVGG